MPLQILNNVYVVINYEKDENIAVIEWKEKCGNLMDPKHDNLFEDIRELIQKVAPLKLLTDMSACEYHVDADTGTWFENPIYALYADLPPIYIAIILPRNFFVKAFFEASLFYEKVDPSKKLQYFKEKEKAWDWLQSIKNN
jgi:hypothetical protein